MAGPVVAWFVLPTAVFFVPFSSIGFERLDALSAFCLVEVAEWQRRPGRVNAVFETASCYHAHAIDGLNELLDPSATASPLLYAGVEWNEVLAVRPSELISVVLQDLCVEGKALA
jgi:hypothetical protein